MAIYSLMSTEHLISMQGCIGNKGENKREMEKKKNLPQSNTFKFIYHKLALPNNNLSTLLTKSSPYIYF